jgi:hypothetical protein
MMKKLLPSTLRLFSELTVAQRALPQTGSNACDGPPQLACAETADPPRLSSGFHRDARSHQRPEMLLEGRLGVVEAPSFNDFAFGVQDAIGTGLVAQVDPDGFSALGLRSRFLHRLQLLLFFIRLVLFLAPHRVRSRLAYRSPADGWPSLSQDAVQPTSHSVPEFSHRQHANAYPRRPLSVQSRALAC